MLAIFCLILLLSFSYDSVVDGKKEVPEKFRMEKINFIWSKAMNLLDKNTKRLEKLQKDLTKFDELYLDLKLRANDIKYADRKTMEQIDTKLEQFLERYDLDKAVHAFRMKYKYNRSKVYSTSPPLPENTRNTVEENPFSDPRLAKIWDDVINDDSFSLGDLDELFYEMKEQQEKLQHYQQLVDESRVEADKMNHLLADTEGEDEDESEQKQIEALTKKSEETTKFLKQLNKQLEENVHELEDRVKQIKHNPFKHKRVRKLWEKALKNRKLIANELDAIKSELRYLERHFEKAEYHAERLDETLEELASGSDPSKRADTIESDGDHTKELRDFQAKLQRKLKKLEHYLDEKLATASADSNLHTEL